MKRLPKREAGMSAVEVIVGLVVICVLAMIAYSWIEVFKPRASPARQLSNFWQLHSATKAMALDGVTAGDTKLAWPGDSDGRFATWVRSLMPDYVATNDFCKLVSVMGLNVSPGRIPLMRETGMRVYGASSNSAGDVVFLSSANFTNTEKGGGSLDAKAMPYGDDVVVVIRMDGRGAILLKNADFLVSKEGAILMRNRAANKDVIGRYAPMLKE